MKGKSSIHNKNPKATRAVKMFIITPPMLYPHTGISSSGLSGGANRHCPPVPATLKRFKTHLPSLRIHVKLKIRNDTKRYPEANPHIRCPASCKVTCKNRVIRKKHINKSGKPITSAICSLKSFPKNAAKVISVNRAIPAPLTITPNKIPIRNMPTSFNACFIDMKIIFLEQK